MRALPVAVAVILLIATACHASSGSPAAAATASAAQYAAALKQHVDPPAKIPAHVQTAEYLWTPQERSADPATYAPYLTWAYPLYGATQRVRAAGIKAIFYINPIMPQRTNYEGSLLMGRFTDVQAKDCDGNTVATYGGKGLLADPRSPRAAAYYENIVSWYINDKIRGRHDWDAFFVDNNGALYGAKPIPCNYDPISWGRAFDRAIASVGVPIVTNSLATRASDTGLFVDRLKAKNIIGGMYERCFNDRQWTAEENSQLQTLALLRRAHKRPGPGWWCYLNDTTAPANDAVPQRLYAYASFLLTYDPKYSLFQESFSTPSTFKVMPETQFVPMQPVKSVKDIADLRTSGGAYVQVYRSCYYRGKGLGSCEIAVNPNSTDAELPNFGAYRHAAALHGSGVLDGGTVTFDAGIPDDLEPQTAAILVR
jgi:hypothetical protein